LHLEDSFFNEASISADFFVRNISAADITLQLNFYKLCLDNKPKHLDDVPNDLVGWDRLNQLNCIFCLEISHRVFDVPDNSEGSGTELQLGVYIDLIRNFTQSFSDQKHMAFLQGAFKIYFL